jgi:hypothetical protein
MLIAIAERHSQELVLDATFDEADAKVVQSYLRYTVLSTYIPVLPPDQVQ